MNEEVFFIEMKKESPLLLGSCSMLILQLNMTHSHSKYFSLFHLIHTNTKHPYRKRTNDTSTHRLYKGDKCEMEKEKKSLTRHDIFCHR